VHKSFAACFAYAWRRITPAEHAWRAVVASCVFGIVLLLVQPSILWGAPLDGLAYQLSWVVGQAVTCRYFNPAHQGPARTPPTGR